MEDPNKALSERLRIDIQIQMQDLYQMVLDGELAKEKALEFATDTTKNSGHEDLLEGFSTVLNDLNLES